MTPEEMEKRIKVLEDFISKFVFSDKYISQKHFQMADARDISFASTKGTRIGTSILQKLGFWNVTPVVQPSSTGTTSNMTIVGGTAVTESNGFTGNLGSTAYTIGDLVKHLKTIGILLQ